MIDHDLPPTVPPNTPVALGITPTLGRLPEAVDGRARALARRTCLAPARRAGDHRWVVADPWFRAATPEPVWLDDMAAVFMRTEPPVDETFTAATLILDLIDPAGTAMVNDPTGLRACSEHLFPLRFPELVPRPWSPRTQVPFGRLWANIAARSASRWTASPAGASYAWTAMTRTYRR
jgi:hypothetical protein